MRSSLDVLMSRIENYIFLSKEALAYSSAFLYDLKVCTIIVRRVIVKYLSDVK